MILQPPGIIPVSKPDVGLAYVFAVLMFVFPLVGAIALVHSDRVAIQIQIRLRAQLTSAVFRKALRLSSRYDMPMATIEHSGSDAQVFYRLEVSLVLQISLYLEVYLVVVWPYQAQTMYKYPAVCDYCIRLSAHLILLFQPIGKWLREN